MVKAMEPNGEWSTQWLDQLKQWIEKKREEDPNNDPPLALYPLQLINCIRLEKNDAVYIFDEVGCGKTISAGLMALHYLCSHEKDVLIITENSVKAQFWNDWMERLPFFDWGFVSGWARKGWYFIDPAQGDRIQIAANNFAQIRDAGRSADCFGMIIIDEAHIFLNSNQQRCTSLRRLAAQNPERIVFLTATPIKESVLDLERYQEIAKTLLGKEPKSGYMGSWKELLSGGGSTLCAGQDGEQESKARVLCSRFDPKLPVTRYFKDTVQALQNSGEHSPRRCLAHLWEYKLEETLPRYRYSENEWRRKWLEAKNAALANGILGVLQGPKGPGQTLPDRFVIFTHLIDVAIDGSVLNLRQYLVDHLVNEYPNLFVNGADDVMAITGSTQHEILAEVRRAAKGRPGGLPRILVVNHQIGEKGLNLPDYNYVINYQISDNPAKLEQRFGRIDRLTSVHHKIHMCYLLRPVGCSDLDSSTGNFYVALNRYMHSLLCQLPVKNVLLDKEQLKKNLEMQKKILERNLRIRNLLADVGKRSDVLEKCAAILEGRSWATDSKWPGDYLALVEFCQEQEIVLNGSSAEDKKNFVSALRRKLSAQNNIYLGNGIERKLARERLSLEDAEKLLAETYKKSKAMVVEMGDKIMVSSGRNAFYLLSAVREEEPEKGCVNYIEEEKKQVDERTNMFLSFCET